MDDTLLKYWHTYKWVLKTKILWKEVENDINHFFYENLILKYQYTSHCIHTVTVFQILNFQQK